MNHFIQKVGRVSVGVAVIAGLVLGAGSVPNTRAVAASAETATPTGLNKINHVIVIYQENWSFDSLYGYFPGANGIANAGKTINQVDKTGKLYKTLPQPINTNLKPAASDSRFLANLPVKPFDAGPYVAPD